MLDSEVLQFGVWEVCFHMVSGYLVQVTLSGLNLKEYYCSLRDELLQMWGICLLFCSLLSMTDFPVSTHQGTLPFSVFQCKILL